MNIKTREIIKTANADYPGLNWITVMVLGYLLFVVICLVLTREVMFFALLGLALTFVAIVANKWLEGYQHWKVHNDSRKEPINDSTL